MSKLSEFPLLSSEMENDIEGMHLDFNGKHRKSSLWTSIRSHILPFLFYSIITVFAMIGVTTVYSTIFPAKHSTSNKSPSLYTPFADGIRYEIKTTSPDYWGSDLYMGEPSIDSERAWNKLIRPGREHGVRLFREEGARLNINESILLPNDNFAVILTVHHNLHCLRRLRQYLFMDEYHPNWTEEDREHDREHSLHCLESIRQSMICQPDIAPIPYYWSGNPWHNMNARPVSTRECVNWEFFSEYLKTRSYHREELVGWRDN